MAGIMAAGFLGLGACGSEVRFQQVTIENGRPVPTDDGSYLAETNVFWRWGDPSAGRNRVGRAALVICGLPPETPFETIGLSEGGGLYNYRAYRFTCPEQGKDEK